MSFECLIGSRIVGDVTNPTPDDVDAEFMMRRLRSMRRFSGHAKALTVAEHLHLCRALAVASDQSDTVIAWAARHDFHEYALGDTVGPLKKALGDSILWIERRWDAAIAEALGVPTPSEEDRKAVGRLDHLALVLEWRFCLGRADRFEWFRQPRYPQLTHMELLRGTVGADRIIGFDWATGLPWEDQSDEVKADAVLGEGVVA